MKREDKTMDLKGRHFLTLKDFTPEEIIYLLDPVSYTHLKGSVA